MPTHPLCEQPLCQARATVERLCRPHLLLARYGQCAAVLRDDRRCRVACTSAGSTVCRLHDADDLFAPRRRAAERAAARNQRVARRAILTKHGLSPQAFAELLVRQDGRCAVCAALLVFGGRSGAHIDHDHATGAVRGLLCAGCNVGLGCFRDSPEKMRAAAAYIEACRVVSPTTRQPDGASA